VSPTFGLFGLEFDVASALVDASLQSASRTICLAKWVATGVLSMRIPLLACAHRPLAVPFRLPVHAQRAVPLSSTPPILLCAGFFLCVIGLQTVTPSPASAARARSFSADPSSVDPS